MNYTLLDREQARKLYHSPSAIRHCKAIVLESEELRHFKKEVSDFNNLQEVVNSSILKKEIRKISRLIRFDVPLASDHQMRIELSGSNSDKDDYFRYVLTVYLERENYA